MFGLLLAESLCGPHHDAIQFGFTCHLAMPAQPVQVELTIIDINTTFTH